MYLDKSNILFTVTTRRASTPAPKKQLTVSIVSKNITLPEVWSLTNFFRINTFHILHLCAEFPKNRKRIPFFFVQGCPAAHSLFREIKDWQRKNAQISNLNCQPSQQGFLTLMWDWAYLDDSNYFPQRICEFQAVFPLLWIKAYLNQVYLNPP